MIEQLKNIGEEETIKLKIDTLKEKYNNFLNILEEYKLTFSNNLESILNEYTEGIYKKVFSKDTLAIIEYQNSLNPEEYKRQYIIKNNLNRNERAEKAYSDLLMSLSELDIPGINKEVDIHITYFTFENTEYQKFIKETVWKFADEWQKFFSDNLSTEDIRRHITDKLFRVNQNYYDICYKQMMNRNTAYYSIVKSEDYHII